MSDNRKPNINPPPLNEEEEAPNKPEHSVNSSEKDPYSDDDLDMTGMAKAYVDDYDFTNNQINNNDSNNNESNDRNKLFSQNNTKKNDGNNLDNNDLNSGSKNKL